MSARSVVNSLAKSGAWAAGFSVRRRQPTDLGPRRVRLAAIHDIDTVLDVGANEGQWAQRLRKDGYAGRIVSFEPLSDACAGLRKRASGDRRWQTYNLGLGACNEQGTIHVAGNSTSSSFLPMATAHAEAAPSSVYVGEQEVRVVTLDSFCADWPSSRRLYLKIDVQGGEMSVLSGALATLAQVDVLELEMSLVPLYEGQVLHSEMAQYVSERGFELVGLDEGFADPLTGRLLQYDAVFERAARST
jgi:FkbM family methyltransferase